MYQTVCPRCLGPCPCAEFVGQYKGALSRTDNKTYVCSRCGTLEAVEQSFGKLMPQEDWGIAVEKCFSLLCTNPVVAHSPRGLPYCATHKIVSISGPEEPF